MRGHLLTVKIEGPTIEMGYVRATDFANELKLLTSAIGRLDRAASADRKVSFYYRIVDLKRTSPAMVVMEACSLDEAIDRRREVTQQFFRLMRQFERDEVEEQVDYQFLKQIRDLAAPIGTTIASLEISADGESIKVTSKLRRHLDQLMEPEEAHRGFIRGVLEYINIHGKPAFRIYPDVGPSLVQCYFPESLTASVIRAIGKFIEVRGILKYKAAADYPHEMEVEEIEIFPPEDELPTFDDLLGIAPDMTGDLSSEDFVRQIRDAKEKQ